MVICFDTPAPQKNQLPGSLAILPLPPDTREGGTRRHSLIASQRHPAPTAAASTATAVLFMLRNSLDPRPEPLVCGCPTVCGCGCRGRLRSARGARARASLALTPPHLRWLWSLRQREVTWTAVWTVAERLLFLPDASFRLLFLRQPRRGRSCRAGSLGSAHRSWHTRPPAPRPQPRRGPAGASSYA